MQVSCSALLGSAFLGLNSNCLFVVQTRALFGFMSRLLGKWPLTEVKEMELKKKMHPQTETVKRFHARPQWQQILAVSTFVGKYLVKNVRPIQWLKQVFMFQKFVNLVYSLCLKTRFDKSPICHFTYDASVDRNEFLITRVILRA